MNIIRNLPLLKVLKIGEDLFIIVIFFLEGGMINVISYPPWSNFSFCWRGDGGNWILYMQLAKA